MGSQPIRVVHLLLTMDVGGLERVALDLVRRSNPRRLDARIVCLREAGALAGPAREMGVRVEALGARGLLDGIPRLARRLRALRPHVLHTHNPGSHRAGVPSRLLARVPHLVHTKHGRNHPDDLAAVARNRRLARFTSVVVAVSEDAARVARETERIPAAKVRVIHNGVELGEPVDPAAWSTWTPRGITVARLDPVKDQTTLLRAARIAVEACPELALEVVGDGPERRRLEALARDLGLEARVSFLGYRSDVSALLRRPQIFVLSSVSEGISLTLLEAMAAGLPAVATDVGGNREVVESGITGLLVPPSQPEALGAALVSLARDPHAARERGAAGRRRVEGHFDAVQTAARYEALYESLLARQSRETLGRPMSISAPATPLPEARVSVVIPAYRAASTIRRAIDSVLAQTRPATEIIVVDDGSPDDQAAIVERAYGDRVILLRQPNGGAARARNAGIDRSTGDFIAFLDADDYWEPEKLAVQLAVFHQDPEVGLVAGAFFEEHPGETRDRRTIRAGPASWYGRSITPRGRSAFRLATLVWTGTVVVSRRVLGEERFVPGLEPAEDRDLWTRLVSQNPAYLTPAPLATAVLVPGSLSRTNVERDCSNMLRVVERHRDLLGFAGRRLWRSYTLYRWAALDSAPFIALPRLLHSFALWPIPYTGFLDCRPFGRMKRLAMLLIASTQRPLPSRLDSRT